MTKIPGAAHPNLALGGLVIVGGALGYIRKGSTPSLIAGLTFGSLLLGSGYMIAKTDSQYQAHLLASGTSGLMVSGHVSPFTPMHTVLNDDSRIRF